MSLSTLPDWGAMPDEEFAAAAEAELVRIEEEKEERLRALASLPDSHRMYARGHGVTTLGEIRRSRPAPAPPPVPKEVQRGFVYVIQAVGTGMVKIGYTTDVAKRLASLQTGSAHELVLVDQWGGTEAKERELHERFAEHRIRGEWFNDAIVEDVCRFMRRRRMFW